MAWWEDALNQAQRFFGFGEPIPAVEGSAADLEDFDGELLGVEAPAATAAPKPNPGDLSGLRVAGNATGLVALGLIGVAGYLLLRR